MLLRLYRRYVEGPLQGLARQLPIHDMEQRRLGLGDKLHEFVRFVGPQPDERNPDESRKRRVLQLSRRHQDRATIDEAISLWQAVAVIDVSRVPSPGAQGLAVRFEDALPAFHGVYEDEIGEVYINRKLEMSERAVTLATDGRIAAGDLPVDVLVPPRVPGDETAGSALAMRPARKLLEADLIRLALRATAGNRTHAAQLLEISHRALLYKLKEYSIRDVPPASKR